MFSECGMCQTFTYSVVGHTIIYIIVEIIRVSLCEPHTSMTSLHPSVYMCTCLLGPTTYRKI